jgi:hypothetical protein
MEERKVVIELDKVRRDFQVGDEVVHALRGVSFKIFEGEFVTDYPNCLDGRPAQASIEAMLYSRVYRVSGEQLMGFFRQDAKKMELRSLIAEHVLRQRNQSYLDFHRATARERYELLLKRCPGIVQHLPLNAISSFLCITPQMLSKIRKGITFEARQ